MDEPNQADRYSARMMSGYPQPNRTCVARYGFKHTTVYPVFIA